MWQLVRLLGILAGSLSLVLLAINGFEIGVAAPFQIMFAYYAAWRDIILSPLVPLLDAIGKLLDARPNLFWGDVVIVLAALEGALVRGTVSSALGYAARAIWGLLCIMMAILVDWSPPLFAFEIIYGISDYSYAGLPAVAAASWAMIMFAGGNVIGSLLTGSSNANRDMMVAIVMLFSVAIYTVLAFGNPDRLSRPEPVGLELNWNAVAAVCYVVFLSVAALCFLIYGVLALRRNPVTNGGFWKALVSSEPGKIVQDLLSIPAAATIFVAANAGLKIAGL